jgi:SAM-dependent methyltransferase
MKWRVDTLAYRADASEGARVQHQELLDELASRVTTGGHMTQTSARRFAELATTLGALQQAMHVQRREVEFSGERMDDIARDVAEAVRSSRELRSIPYMSDAAAFESKDEAGRPALGYGPSEKSGAIGYVGFENLFRGSEELIRGRQRIYVAMLDGHGPVVDLGSGRGEMLDLLREAGTVARGVDLDESMVDHARAKGHDVVLADALEYLAGQPDRTIGAIFTAQFVEHLPYRQLLELIRDARRVLRDGGLLVMETVNPYSIAAFRTFWTDLTHQSPIFPEVLLALTRDSGFPEARVIFPTGTGDLEADRWGTGEYAVVARN